MGILDKEIIMAPLAHLSENTLCQLYKSIFSLSTVDGGYSDWSAYGDCSKYCGTGKQIRTRRCDAPAPQHGGKDCSQLGNDKEEKSCNTQACPS